MFERCYKNILELFYDFLEDSDNASFKESSKYLNKIIGLKYFTNKNINAKNIKKCDRNRFRYFVHKYKLSLNIIHVSTLFELVYYNTFNINSLQLNFNFNNTEYQYLIPPTTKNLQLPQCVDQNIELPSLHSLTFYDNFNQSINKGFLPSTLKKLKLGIHFDRYLDNLPDSLQSLKLSRYFNNSLDNLPSSLKKLTCGYYFNQPLNNLPSSLEKLNLGIKFTQLIKNFPPSILYIRFNSIKAPSLINLPPKLEQLHLGYACKEFIDKIILPTSLHTLSISLKYEKNIEALKYLHNLPIKNIGFNSMCQGPFYIQKMLLNEIKEYITPDQQEKKVTLDVICNNDFCLIKLLTVGSINMHISYSYEGSDECYVKEESLNYETPNNILSIHPPYKNKIINKINIINLTHRL
jgi:hypothetical protein